MTAGLPECEKHEFRFLKEIQKDPLITKFYCIYCLNYYLKRSDFPQKIEIEISEKKYQDLIKKQKKKK